MIVSPFISFLSNIHSMRKNWFRWRVRLILVSLLPVAWRAYAQDSSVLSTYQDITFTIGIVSGLVAYTMLALTFVLSWRFRFVENAFGGLDKMYIVHAIVGSSAFVFMLIHPIFLVLKYIPDRVYLAAQYLLPGSHRSINFGIAASFTTILLMMLTLYFKKMKYNKWKNTHTFFSLTFLFVAIHVFLIKWELATIYFPWYFVYATIVAVAWLGAYAYSILWRWANKHKVFEYQISKIIAHNDKATEILLTTKGKKISYEAGQFAFFKFKSDEVSSEPHPFSLASSSKSNNWVRVIMKHSGDFTNTLPRLCVGDSVMLEWPYGKFTLNANSWLKQVWIAWGIGITPFIAMADELVYVNDVKVDLYYLVRTQDDLIGLNYLQEIAKKLPSFLVIPRVSSTQWYLDIRDMASISGNLRLCEYYLCWPTGMKETFTKLLRDRGVPSRRLYSEAYTFKI